MRSDTYTSHSVCAGGLAWIALLFAGAAPPVLHAETLNVAVAANFMTTMQHVQAGFEASTEHRINLISGSSGSHYAQIVNGAPFDLFLSADAARPAALQQAGIITADQRRVYALGRLALWSADPAATRSLDDLSRLQPSQRLAIANPRLAPYGQAAVAMLEYYGLYENIKNQLVMGENVGQTFQFAFSGSARFGLVAYAQVLASPVRGSHILPPDCAYQSIVQEMALLVDSPASRALFDYLGSPEVAEMLVETGYYAPSGLPEVSEC